MATAFQPPGIAPKKLVVRMVPALVPVLPAMATEEHSTLYIYPGA